MDTLNDIINGLKWGKLEPIEAHDRVLALFSVSNRAFVNVYEDDDGRFISDEEYSSYDSAFENKDDLSTYRETVEIVRYVS